jgi:hypothetical protein
LAAAAGPVGIAIGAMVLAGAALQEVYEQGHQLAREQEQHARQLAESSAKQAAIIAELDVNRTFRQMETGDRTAESTAGLTKAIDRWEQAVQPFEELVTVTKNAVAEGFLDTVADIALALQEMLPLIRFLIETSPAIQAFKSRRKREEEDIGGPLPDMLKRVHEDMERERRAAEERMRRLREIHNGR